MRAALPLVEVLATWRAPAIAVTRAASSWCSIRPVVMTVTRVVRPIDGTRAAAAGRVNSSRLAAASLVSLLTFAACSTEPSTRAQAADTNTCAQPMDVSKPTLQATAFKGGSLPEKTVALSFDDGPGLRTLELSAYLRDEGIRAAFFVNGRCFTANDPCGNPGRTPAEVFDQVLADGHIIGNHTQDHFDLTSESLFPDDASGSAAMVAELAKTHAILAPWIEARRALFRPPYGYWNARASAVLGASPMALYTGPVLWDVGGAMKLDDDATGFAADWDCWEGRSGFGKKTSRECATRYLNEFRSVGRGISLMHDATAFGDETNHDVDSGTGNTVDMVKLLVPLLKSDGFSFARIDEVPYIAAYLPSPRQACPRPSSSDL